VAHAQLDQAAHAAHKRQALGPLQALLQLLGVHSAMPGPSQYLLHMLTRLLPLQSLQDVVCGEISGLMQLLFKGAQREAAAPAQPVAQALAKKVASSAEVQQGQLRLLEDVLPSLVIALVECIEARGEVGSVAGTVVTAASTSRHRSGAGSSRVSNLALPATGLPPDDPLLKLLLTVLEGAPTPVKGSLRGLESLPASQQVRDLLSGFSDQQPCSLPEQLHLFAARAAHIGANGRRRGVETLQQILDTRPAELFTSAGIGHRAGQGPRVLSGIDPAASLRPGEHHVVEAEQLHPVAAAAGWRLARLAVRFGDASMASLSARLLAALRPVAETADSLTWAATIGRADHAGGGDTAPHTHEALVAGVLEQLYIACLDADPGVVRVAQRSLLALLPLDAAKAVLRAWSSGAGDTGSDSGVAPAGDEVRQDGAVRKQQVLMHSLLQSFRPKGSASGDVAGLNGGDLDTELELFCTCHAAAPTPPCERPAQLRLTAAPSVVAGQQSSGANSTGAMSALDCDELWQVSPRGFDRWITNLVVAMLHACGSSWPLSCLASAAGVLPAVASLLLPHALLELCWSAARSDAAQTGDGAVGAGTRGAATPCAAARSTAEGCLAMLARRVEQHVLHDTTETPAVRAILGALEFLRCTHRRAIVAGEGRSASRGLLCSVVVTHIMQAPTLMATKWRPS